jgi:hypothetical protein
MAACEGDPAVDYAHALKDLSDDHFPDVTKIVLLQDNLNTHTKRLRSIKRGRESFYRAKPGGTPSG